MFTNFKIPAAELATRLAQMQAGFKASGKPGEFEANALRVVGQRMLRAPQQYIEFGPFWWAVKAALASAGYKFGDLGDPLVAAEYCGATPSETLVAAEAFKDFYRAKFFVGTANFDLDDSGEDYLLDDPDMKARIGA